MNNIGEFIEKLRKAKGITQKELGKAIGVDDKVISKWERSVYLPDISMLGRLSNALNITVDELVNCEVHEKDPLEEKLKEANDKIEVFTKNNKLNKIVMLFQLLLIIIISISLIVSTKNYLYNKKNAPEPVNVYEIETSGEEVYIKGYIFEKGTEYITVLTKLIFQDNSIGTREYKEKLEKDVVIQIVDNNKKIYNYENKLDNVLFSNDDNRELITSEYKNTFNQKINFKNLKLKVAFHSDNEKDEIAKDFEIKTSILVEGK